MKKIILFALLLCISSLVAVRIETTSLIVEAPSQYQVYGNYIANNLENRIEALQTKLGVYPDKKLLIRIAPSQKVYSEWAGGGRGIVENSEAFYRVAEQTMYIRSPRHINGTKQAEDIYLHEYIHFLTGLSFPDAPLWFQEGMAVYFSGQYQWQQEVGYSWDFLWGSRLPLKDMRRDYPENRMLWSQFYAKSAQVVRFMQSERKEAFERLWDRAGEKERFAKAFRLSFYQSLSAFEEQYEITHKRQIWVQILLAYTSILWGLLPFILLPIWWWKRRNKIEETTEEDDEWEYISEETENEESISNTDHVSEGSRRA